MTNGNDRFLYSSQEQVAEMVHPDNFPRKKSTKVFGRNYSNNK